MGVISDPIRIFHGCFLMVDSNYHGVATYASCVAYNDLHLYKPNDLNTVCSVDVIVRICNNFLPFTFSVFINYWDVYKAD